MSIKQAVYDRLRGDATLAAVVGDRIYPDILPQQPAFPALTYIRRSVDRHKTFCGTGEMARSSFQVDAWALTYEDAERVAQHVRTSLVDFKGIMAGSPGVAVSDVRLENEFDLSDLEPGLFRVSMDFLISHDETI